MLVCLDVDYRDPGAVAAAVLFRHWADAEPAGEVACALAGVAPYVPGRFFERELPCLLAVLGRITEPLDVIVVDGYVWLGPGHPGMGARLYEALGERIPVVGVAKTRFTSAAGAGEVFRGGSAKPLLVTAAGLDLAPACAAVASMHGPHRIPDLLRRVDRLCREAPG